jgi:hypothetical protein
MFTTCLQPIYHEDSMDSWIARSRQMQRNGIRAGARKTHEKPSWKGKNMWGLPWFTMVYRVKIGS